MTDTHEPGCPHYEHRNLRCTCGGAVGAGERDQEFEYWWATEEARGLHGWGYEHAAAGAAWVAATRRAEQRLREALWLGHGCEGLYGDDGEMQCGACQIDFRRAPIGEIAKRLMDNAVNVRKLRTARAEVERLRDIIGKKRLGQHMHGSDVCVYCAIGEAALKERDILATKIHALRAQLAAAEKYRAAAATCPLCGGNANAPPLSQRAHIIGCAAKQRDAALDAEREQCIEEVRAAIEYDRERSIGAVRDYLNVAGDKLAAAIRKGAKVKAPLAHPLLPPKVEEHNL